MKDNFDVVVVGAGPAGSAAAIAAADRGLRVLLLEANRFPRHKVCGEFVSAESAEVLRYLLRADIDELFRAPRIAAARLHSAGHSVDVQFETPAYSIPRYTLDEALWKGANGRGVDCRYETVQDVAETIDGFRVSTAKGVLHSKTVINASGRWSKLSRREGDESWIGLKAHFQGPTDDLVHLYFAKGTYCGVQAAAPGVVNACALVRQGVARDLKQVFQLDPDLAASSESWKPITETFATAPVYLGPGDAIASGMLQVGDAAGFVDPFVGDGISLALRTGVLAGRCACSVSQERYAELYRHSFANIFSSAGRARSLLRLVTTMPRMLHALRLPQIGKKIFESTRRANLDVLQCSIS